MIPGSKEVHKEDNEEEVHAAKKVPQDRENNLHNFQLSWLLKIDDVVNFMIESLVLNLATPLCMQFQIWTFCWNVLQKRALRNS